MICMLSRPHSTSAPQQQEQQLHRGVSHRQHRSRSSHKHSMEDEDNSGPGYDPIAEEFATCAACPCRRQQGVHQRAHADSDLRACCRYEDYLDSQITGGYMSDKENGRTSYTVRKRKFVNGKLVSEETEKGIKPKPNKRRRDPGVPR